MNSKEGMIEKIHLRQTPEEAADRKKTCEMLTRVVGLPVNNWRLQKKSIDARQKQIWIEADYLVATGENESAGEPYRKVEFRKVSPESPSVVIVGAGPAGLFAALRALELGWRPIILERGKAVEERIHDVVALQKEGKLNPDSNFCFGEGGAGAFSDGKLFTRSKKRGNVEDVLALLCQHGAKEEIMYEAHPHIGSDKLPKVIKAIRQTIIDKGGEVHFSTPFSRLIIRNGEVKGVVSEDGKEFYGPVILATGHSARDVYRYLDESGIRLEAKGFAMGVRLEHPQKQIDSIIYHDPKGRGELLPPAEYKVSAQVDGRGVYSFCMCPGGVIVPSASSPGEGVVNGMSASGRSGRWANSGMVVEIRPEDFPEYQDFGALSLLRLQEDTEKRFYESTGSYRAPAQRMSDFVAGKKSQSLPATSYVPGLDSKDLTKLLPDHISKRLQKGFQKFGRKYPGFLTNDAVMIGLESRTSSPVRIPRDPETLQHPELPGLFPVGEGAGYAGGIVSAAVDGRNAMDKVTKM